MPGASAATWIALTPGVDRHGSQRPPPARNEVLIAALIVTLAGLVHGTLGLGFPMVAPPVLALLTDVQTAILLTLAPNIAVNLWSMLRGGNLSESVGRYWPVAVWMLIGSAVGTVIL